MRYEHAQTGTVLLATLLVPALLLGTYLVTVGVGIVALSISGILVLSALGFGMLTVTVDDREVVARFGVPPVRGWFRKRFAVGEITAVRVVRNSWWWGFGIRYTPYGWLYNVAGRDAVELQLASGKRVRIGTDDPAALRTAVARATGTAAVSDAAFAGKAPWTWVPVIVAAVILTVAAGVVGMLFVSGTRPPTVAFESDRFTVSGQYSRTVVFDEVAGISLEAALPAVRTRLNGFAGMGERRGRFRLDELGEGYLFSSVGHPPYLLVRTTDSFVVINYEDPDETRALHDALVARWRAR